MGLRCLLCWSCRCECWGCLRISSISRSIRDGMFLFSIFFVTLFGGVFWYQNVKSYANWHCFRAVVSAGPYRDISEEGKFYAVVLEQTQNTSVHASHETHMGTPWWTGLSILFLLSYEHLSFLFMFISHVLVHFYHAIISVFNLFLNLSPRMKLQEAWQ